jgi:hypothetical protein
MVAAETPSSKVGNYCVRFQVLMAAHMKIRAFWEHRVVSEQTDLSEVVYCFHHYPDGSSG